MKPSIRPPWFRFSESALPTGLTACCVLIINKVLSLLSDRVSVVLLIVLLFQFSAMNAIASEKVNAFNRAMREEQLVEAKKIAKTLTAKEINSLDSQSESPLMATAGSGEIEILEILLSKKPNLEIKNNEGETALGLAVHSEQNEAAELLRKAGAKDDTTCGKDLPNLLFCAIRVNNEALVKELVVKHPDWIFARVESSGSTPLHLAAQESSKKVIQFLLDAKADKKAKNKSGSTPFDLAKKMNRKKILPML